MLEFIYTGSYEIDEPGSANHGPSSQVLGVRGKAPTIAAVGNALLLHLEMNSIADFYGVHQLRKTTVRKIRYLLTEYWGIISRWYPAFLEAAFEETNDFGLHMLLVEITASRFSDLYGLVFGCGAKVDVPPWFYSAVLERSRESVIKMKEVLMTADQMWQSLTNRIKYPR